jgi:serine/tyrosine/threonine adenylyltransferase
MTFHFPFENTYARLPERFFARISPTPVAAPRLVRLNEELARELRLHSEWLKGPEALEVLAGKRVPEGADPIATAYAGHQFRAFRAATWGWPRNPPGRSCRPQREMARHPA